jgi:hypothetical protein
MSMVWSRFDPRSQSSFGFPFLAWLVQLIPGDESRAQTGSAVQEYPRVRHSELERMQVSSGMAVLMAIQVIEM